MQDIYVDMQVTDLLKSIIFIRKMTTSNSDIIDARGKMIVQSCDLYMGHASLLG